MINENNKLIKKEDLNDLFWEIFKNRKIFSNQIMYVFGAGLDINWNKNSRETNGHSWQSLNQKMIMKGEYKRFCSLLDEPRIKTFHPKIIGQLLSPQSEQIISFYDDLKKEVEYEIDERNPEIETINEIAYLFNQLDVNLVTTNFFLPKQLKLNRSDFTYEENGITDFTKVFNSNLFFHGSVFKKNAIYSNAKYTERYSELNKDIQKLQKAFKDFKVILIFGMSFSDVDFLNLWQSICKGSKIYIFNVDFNLHETERELVSVLSKENFKMNTIFYDRQDMSFFILESLRFILKNGNLTPNEDYEKKMRKQISAIASKRTFISKLSYELAKEQKVEKQGIFTQRFIFRLWQDKLDELEIKPSELFCKIQPKRPQVVWELACHYLRNKDTKKLNAKEIQIVLNELLISQRNAESKYLLLDFWKKSGSQLKNENRLRLLKWLFENIEHGESIEINEKDFLQVEINKDRVRYFLEYGRLKKEKRSFFKFSKIFERIETLDSGEIFQYAFNKLYNRETFSMPGVTESIINEAVEFLNKNLIKKTKILKTRISQYSQKKIWKWWMVVIFNSRAKNILLEEFGFQNNADEIHDILDLLPMNFYEIRTKLPFERKFFNDQENYKILHAMLIYGIEYSEIEKIALITKLESKSPLAEEVISKFLDNIKKKNFVPFSVLFQEANKDEYGDSWFPPKALKLKYWCEKKITTWEANEIIEILKKKKYIKGLDKEVKKVLEEVLDFPNSLDITHAIELSEEYGIKENAIYQFFFLQFFSNQMDFEIKLKNIEKFIQWWKSDYEKSGKKRADAQGVLDKGVPYVNYEESLEGKILIELAKEFSFSSYALKENIKIFDLIKNLVRDVGRDWEDAFFVYNTFALGLTKSVEIIKTKTKPAYLVALLSQRVSIGTKQKNSAASLAEAAIKSEEGFGEINLLKMGANEVVRWFEITNKELTGSLLKNTDIFYCAALKFFKRNGLQKYNLFANSIWSFISDSKKAIDWTDWQSITRKVSKKSKKLKNTFDVLVKIIHWNIDTIDTEDFIRLAIFWPKIQDIPIFVSAFVAKARDNAYVRRELLKNNLKLLFVQQYLDIHLKIKKELESNVDSAE